MIIYKLTSPSNKSYVGLTEKKLEHRLSQHIINSSKDNKTQLNKALKKYPIDQWNIEILEKCENRDQLVEKEIFYINKFDTYNNGYNMTLGGDGVDSNSASKLRLEYYKSDKGKEWKKELSKRFKENNPNKKGNIPWNKGKVGCFKHTEETKKKLSDIKKKTQSAILKKAWKEGKFDNRKNASNAEEMEARGCTMKGRKQSDNQKKLVAEKLSAKWEVKFPSGEIKTINNLNAFCREHNLDPANLKKTLPSGPGKQHKGFVLLKKVKL